MRILQIETPLLIHSGLEVLEIHSGWFQAVGESTSPIGPVWVLRPSSSTAAGSPTHRVFGLPSNPPVRLSGRFRSKTPGTVLKGSDARSPLVASLLRQESLVVTCFAQKHTCDGRMGLCNGVGMGLSFCGMDLSKVRAIS